jgi:hypothetical protein
MPRSDPNVDAIAMEMASGFLARRWQADPKSLDAMLDTLVAHQERSSKPFVAVLQMGHVEEVAIQARKRVQSGASRCSRGSSAPAARCAAPSTTTVSERARTGGGSRSGSDATLPSARLFAWRPPDEPE